MRIGLLVGCFLLISSQAFALTAEWNRNSETDMKEYHMYMCETANCTVSKTPALIKGTVPQPAVGVVPSWPIPAGKSGSLAVTALDTSGNESPLSNVIFFDQTPPATPTGVVTK